MTNFWIEYQQDQREKIARRQADEAAGIRRCAEPGCREPVAAQRRPNDKYGPRANACTSKQRYCVLHAGADELRRHMRYESDRKARKAAGRARQAEALQRMGEAGS